MPFKAVYSVLLANANLTPHLNLLNWPGMQVSVPTANDQSTRTPDSEGLVLELTRSQTATGTARNSIHVAPPGGLHPGTRVMMRLMFDQPDASGLSAVSDPFLQPWAVALRAGTVDHLAEGNTVTVTCQFHRSRGGVRLNTVNELTSDQATLLDGPPLEYARYQGSTYKPLPPDLGGPIADGDGGGAGGGSPNAPSLFVLEHSLIGLQSGEASMAGTGGLSLLHKGQAERRDHRVYASTSLSADSPIRALGFELVTAQGLGHLRARMRSFSVFINETAQ